jgi:hypothetical protein
MKITKKLVVVANSLICAVLLCINVPLADAFSGSGSGISSDPYVITTCSELESIESNLSAYYVLGNNIDCTGTSFASISGTFTGTLNGQNYTISNLNFAPNNAGLFDETNSGATIENLDITSGSLNFTSNSEDLGSVVGHVAGTTTLTNVQSAVNIGSSSDPAFSDAGGLVGYVPNGDLTISNSSYTGTFYSDINSGGLVGYLEDSSNLISNSYFNGTFNLLTETVGGVPQTPDDDGGIVGVVNTVTISNSYSAGNINYSSGSDDIGGLAGITDDTTFTDDFAASTIAGSSSSDIGAAFGFFESGSSRSNIYFDSYLANDMSGSSIGCAGLDQGSGNCTAENVTNASPSYFKGNDTSAPLNNWDFTTIWQVNSGNYPTFIVSSNNNTSGVSSGSGSSSDSQQTNDPSVSDPDTGYGQPSSTPMGAFFLAISALALTAVGFRLINNPRSRSTRN